MSLVTFLFFFFEFTFGKISCCLKFYQICFSLLTRFLLIIDVTMHSVHRWHHKITQPYLVWDDVCKVRVLCFEKWKRYGVGGITFLYSLVNHMQILHPLFFSKLELIKKMWMPLTFTFINKYHLKRELATLKKCESFQWTNLQHSSWATNGV